MTMQANPELLQLTKGLLQAAAHRETAAIIILVPLTAERGEEATIVAPLMPEVIADPILLHSLHLLLGTGVYARPRGAEESPDAAANVVVIREIVDRWAKEAGITSDDDRVVLDSYGTGATVAAELDKPAAKRAVVASTEGEPPVAGNPLYQFNEDMKDLVLKYAPQDVFTIICGVHYDTSEERPRLGAAAAFAAPDELQPQCLLLFLSRLLFDEEGQRRQIGTDDASAVDRGNLNRLATLVQAWGTAAGLRKVPTEDNPATEVVGDEMTKLAREILDDSVDFGREANADDARRLAALVLGVDGEGEAA